MSNLRQDADNTAIERMKLLIDIPAHITGLWSVFSDEEKISHLNSAIELVKSQIEDCDDSSICDCMQWEIAEMERSRLFFRQATGQVPVDGQLNLF